MSDLGQSSFFQLPGDEKPQNKSRKWIAGLAGLVVLGVAAFYFTRPKGYKCQNGVCQETRLITAAQRSQSYPYIAVCQNNCGVAPPTPIPSGSGTYRVVFSVGGGCLQTVPPQSVNTGVSTGQPLVVVGPCAAASTEAWVYDAAQGTVQSTKYPNLYLTGPLDGTNTPLYLGSAANTSAGASPWIFASSDNGQIALQQNDQVYMCAAVGGANPAIAGGTVNLVYFDKCNAEPTAQSFTFTKQS